MEINKKDLIIACSLIAINASLLTLSSWVKENTKRIESLEIESLEKKSNMAPYFNIHNAKVTWLLYFCLFIARKKYMASNERKME